MDAVETLDLIQKGESSVVSFKVRINDAYKIGTEMVAFSNTKGGLIIIGVDDVTGDIDGLSFKEIADTNQLLVKAASDNVKPQIFIETITLNVGYKNVVVVRKFEGLSKLHANNKGIIWLKNGSDKRKVVAREEMARLLQSSGNLYTDETLVSGSTIDDVNEDLFRKFIVLKNQNN